MTALRSGLRPRAAASRVRVLALAVLTIAAAVAAPVQADDARAGWNRLCDGLDGRLQRDRVVGAGFALVEDGRIVARHHYGFADRAGGRRVDAGTIFHWASITKTLNAVATMQLRDHGQITLEQSVTDHLPELRRVHNPFGSMDDITIAMLMEHSAGFQASTWPHKKGEPWEPFEPRHWEQLVAMMPYQQIAFEPGSRFSYSNPAWIYLARILEQTTGDPWEAYIQKNIFAPLGMSRSYFAATPYHLRADRSHGYFVETDEAGQPAVIDRGGEFDPGITVPNGGWNAPLDDVAAFVAFLTGADGGDAERRRNFHAVLGRDTLEEMWRSRQSMSSEPGADRYMGLGFFVSGSGEHRLIGHTGSQGGFLSFLFFNPATGRGVIGVFNTTSALEGEDNYRSFHEVMGAATALLR